MTTIVKELQEEQAELFYDGKENGVVRHNMHLAESTTLRTANTLFG